MNSVTRYLTPATIAATLLAMRSGRKEIFLIVEGDSDVDLMSQLLELDHSNFVSCHGKENLDGVFALAPAKGIDEGAVFIRDRDHDKIAHSDKDGVRLFVTDYYDVEMQLLSTRLFERIYREYHRGQLDALVTSNHFNLVVDASAWIGALRLYNSNVKGSFEFDDLKLTRFLEIRTLSIDVSGFIRYMLAKSKAPAANSGTVEAAVRALYASCTSRAMIVCGKDFISVLHLMLHRHLDLCSSSEADPKVLTRMLRAAATLDDIKTMSMYAQFSDHVARNKYHWPGVSL